MVSPIMGDRHIALIGHQRFEILEIFEQG